MSTTTELRALLDLPDTGERNRTLGDVLLRELGAPQLKVRSLEVPSEEWALEVVGEFRARPTRRRAASGSPPVPARRSDGLPHPEKTIVALEFEDLESQRQFHQLALRQLASRDAGSSPRVGGIVFSDVGADPGGAPADHWCPGRANLATFGTRAEARRLIGADVLRKSDLTGSRVNVVIVDQGLDKAGIPAKNWGGGINYKGRTAGAADPASHGMLIARNVLDLAPDAVLYDVPLIPPAITDVLSFASDADALFQAMQVVVPVLQVLPRWSGPWVIVNAWAIFDRTSEAPLGDYTEDLNPFGHPLNKTVGAVVAGTGVDVVFAAGNCGQFCPSRRCSPVDRGPGRSIWGANAHPAVVTVGAVRTDEEWLGYSSQGPGPEKLAVQKPDLCAPSNFTETLDAHVQNTGTSAACGLVAGAIAALRSNPAWDRSSKPPATLKQALISSALRVGGPGWSERFGNGVLDVATAFARLKT